MFITIKGKKLLLGIIITLLIIAFITVISISSVATSAMTAGGKKIPIYRVDRGDEKVVALSFDAAWGADKTQGIIDILNRYEAKATFFLVGFWIDAYEKEVKAINDNGLEIGNHSRNHLKMSTLSPNDIDAEMKYVNDAVNRITGKTPKVFRAPFGDYNNKLMDRVTASGMTGIQWDVDSLDWKGISANEITQRVIGRVKSGSIVLFHNNSDHILDALPTIMERLKSDGYKFVTMSELIHHGEYTIDNNGEQHAVKSN